MFDKESSQDQLPQSVSNLRIQMAQERKEHRMFIHISKKILLEKWKNLDTGV